MIYIYKCFDWLFSLWKTFNLSIDHSLYIFYPISGKFTKVVKITPGIWMALMEGKGQELQDKVRIFKQ